VVSGQLDEATAEADATVVRTVGPGETVSFASSRVHAVVNRGSLVATSIHVYSPPLSSMMYYRQDEGQLVGVAEDAASWETTHSS
jgi:hypothetical protein